MGVEMKTEFDLSDKIDMGDCINVGISVENVKEFIKRLLTPNNISKGFVEVSTIKYYVGEKLI